jgi:signal transduction histidine kinase
MDLNLHLLEEELKERASLPEVAARYLHILNAECHRLSVILDNFMKFARPGPVGLHEVNVSALIGHIMALIQFEAEERKICLEQAVEQSLPSVLGDETAISQVLVNVVVNAFHAMPNGGFCRIAAETRHANGTRWVVLSVKDTGIGIKKEELARVFEPFYTTKSSGTGLGLPIAHRIMEDHGGTIQISSTPGIGTTVVMTFPVTVEEPQPLVVIS